MYQEMNANMNAVPVNKTEMENATGNRQAKLTHKAMEAKIMSLQKEGNTGIKQLCKMAKELNQIMC